MFYVYLNQTLMKNGVRHDVFKFLDAIPTVESLAKDKGETKVSKKRMTKTNSVKATRVNTTLITQLLGHGRLLICKLL